MAYLLCVEDAENVQPLEKALFLLPVFDNNLGGLDGDVTALDGPEAGTANDERKFTEFCHANLICLLRIEWIAGPALVIVGGLLLMISRGFHSWKRISFILEIIHFSLFFFILWKTAKSMKPFKENQSFSGILLSTDQFLLRSWIEYFLLEAILFLV